MSNMMRRRADKTLIPILWLLPLMLMIVQQGQAQETPPPDMAQCPAELVTDDSAGHTIHWPAINSTLRNVQSSPLCLDGERFLLARNCSQLGWQPFEAPQCAYTQQSFVDTEKCPLGYRTIGGGGGGSDQPQSAGATVCILLTAHQPWNNTCLPSGTARTVLDLSPAKRALVFGYLAERQVQRVWMPARRRRGFGPVVWTLAGRVHGETVDFDEEGIEYEDWGAIAETGCFALNATNEGRSGSVEDCSRELPVLCVYDEDTSLVRLACPPDFVTTRYEGLQHECFATKRVKQASELDRGAWSVLGRQQQQQVPSSPSGEYNWVESECQGELYSLNDPERTVLFERFSRRAILDANDRCLVGVLPNVLVENRTQWQDISANVSWVNWAAPVDQGPPTATNVVMADRHGRWHWSADFSCIACQRRVDQRRPHIELKFYEGHLYAVVYNREYFWREHSVEAGFKCFTDADNELVRTVRIEGEVWSGWFEEDRVEGAPIRDKTRTVYELRTYGDGPGYYWCEGHAIPDFRAVQSVPVVAHKQLKGVVFAVMMRTACSECRLLVQNRHIKLVAQRLRSSLNRWRRAIRRQMAGEELSIENVRVMKIDAIDVEHGHADLLFHVTVAFDDDELDDSEEDRLELTTDMLKVYRMRNHLHRILHANSSAEFTYRGLNSTEYCLPTSISAATDLSWGSARIGEAAAPLELCLLPSGLPVRRQCVGDYVYGGMWHNVTRPHQQICDQQRLSPITRSLYEIDRTFNTMAATSVVIQNVTQLIESTDHARLIPADLFYLGRVMQTIIRFNQLNNEADGGGGGDAHNNATAPAALLKRAESENIFTIYNRLMFLNENTTRLSAALNSTNVLLEALDNVVNHLSSRSLTIRSRIHLTENKHDGTIAMLSDKLLVYVIDPIVRNVSGIALRRRRDRPRPQRFDDYEVRLLRTDQTTAGLMADEWLEVAAFVPQSLLRRLDETRHMQVMTAASGNGSNGNGNSTKLPTFLDAPPPVSIVVTIYYNDLLFQEFRRTTFAKPGGKIISVSIPGYGPILPDLLPIFINTDRFDSNASISDPSNVCGYWNFQTDTWSNDGCEFGGSASVAAENPSTTVMCACSHLTHFAYLIMGTYFHSFNGDDDLMIVMDTHQVALDLITLLGCSLSLAGILGIFVTALVFPAWREKANSKVLLHLCAAIGLQMVLLCFVNTEVRSMHFFVNEQWHGCVTMGAMLHYSVLVAFNWMLITAYLQFMRYVRVIGHTRSSRFLLKSSLVGWGLPLIPVGLVVVVAPQAYIPDASDVGQSICYPTGYALYFGVILPMAVIVLANLVIFILVIYHILHGPDGKLRTATERDLTLAQLRLCILLFFLLGLTWIFGFCAVTHAGLVFSYLFCLTATLQGFVLFLYFIILDPVTRHLWSEWLKRYLGCGAMGGDELK